MVFMLGVLAVLIISVGGCTSSTSNNAPQATVSTTANTASVTPTPSSTAQATAAVTAKPLIRTTISVWEGYMGMPAEWLNYPVYNVTLRQGGSEQVRYVVNAADGTHPCGAANYYIDDHAAYGKWHITRPTAQYGCSAAGMPGGAGGLYLYPNDTAKLAAGWHTLKIDYLGDNTYAPSEYVARFLVVK
jgi:hypothetical protein